MENAFSYAGRRALVVGCYSGMGAATAEIVQLLGGEVHGVDYKQPDAALASFTACDLRDEAQIDAMLAAVGTDWDAVFYCAGLPQTHPPLDVMRVNFMAMRKVVDAMTAGMKPGGAVAIISSNAGLQFMSHMAEITELIETPDFDAGMAWCEGHLDLVNEGYTLSKEAIIIFTMRRAIEALHPSPEHVLVDGNRLPPLPMPAQALVGGDATVPAISAASVLAKVHRDRLCLALDRDWPAYGFAVHKGYPTAAHLQALQRHGPCPAHRRSFAPVRAALAALPGGQLP